MADGVEADGTPTRERLKFLPRVVNLCEFKPHLYPHERKLVQLYAGKPFMTRPQQSFHRGANYLEIDFNAYEYAFMFRKTICAFTGRCEPVVFDNSFIIEGQRAEDLPEVLLGGVRLYRLPFSRLPILSVDSSV